MSYRVFPLLLSPAKTKIGQAKQKIDREYSVIYAWIDNQYDPDHLVFELALTVCLSSYCVLLSNFSSLIPDQS
jgi:hypothetical protein